MIPSNAPRPEIKKAKKTSWTTASVDDVEVEGVKEYISAGWTQIQFNATKMRNNPATRAGYTVQTKLRVKVKRIAGSRHRIAWYNPKTKDFCIMVFNDICVISKERMKKFLQEAKDR